MTRLRVMFIDDEPNILSGLRRMLHGQRGEWEMLFANGGAEGLAMMAAQPVDVLVCDMRMPAMSGLQVFTAVQAQYPATARIILTGQTEREVLISALSLTHRFLLKPCRAEDLIATIQQMVDVRTAIGEGRIQAFLGTASWLPRPPSVYLRINEEAAKPDCQVSDLVAVIQQDVASTADLLKLVNSAVFATSHPIESLTKAVVMLGFETIKTLLLASAAYRVDVPMPPSLDLPGLAKQGLIAAGIAKRIAMAEGEDRDSVSNLFLCGLLQNVGLLVQVAAHPEGWDELQGASAEPWERVVTEVAVFGCTTSQASAYLLGLWGFAAAVVETVLAQPVRDADTTATPAAHMLSYARMKVLEPERRIEPTVAGYLTAERLAQWDLVAAEVLEGLERDGAGAKPDTAAVGSG